MSGVVEESVTGVRIVKGFGVERLQRTPPRDRGRQRLRPLDGPGQAARQLHAADRLPARARPGRHPLVRRPPGARRPPDGRRHRRREPLRADADLAAAHDRHAARAAAPLGRGRGPHQRRARHRSRDRRHAARQATARRPGEVRFERRDVRLRPGPARARRARSRDPRRSGGRARRARPRRARRPSPGSSRASTTSTPATSASTAPTCATCASRDVRRAVGLVFEDTFLFSDTRALQHRVRRSRSVDGSRRARGASSPAPTTSSASCPTATTPSSASTATRCRAVSVSASRSRARCSPIPRILILDDATSSVDPTKEHEIRAALAEVMQGRTTIIIAHRPATIALADRVVLLDGGQVIADGTHEGLLASSAEYREVLARAAVEKQRRGRRRPTVSTTPSR